MNIVVEGRLVDPDFGVEWGQVEIVEGQIARVGALGLHPDLKLDQAHLVFPGFVDVHVHLRQGDEYKEDFQSGTRAALHGGVTAMLDMPNNPVPPRFEADLAVKRGLVKDLPVDIDFYLGLGEGTRPSPPHPFYKAFMGPSIGPLFFHDDADLEEVVRHYTGQRITFHCEDPELLRTHQNAPLHEDQRPPEAEIKAVGTALKLAQKHGFFVHVAHLTCLESLLQIEASASPPDESTGLKGVVCESTPHHLYFDRDNRRGKARDSFLKMNPPLRTPETRARLLEAFLAGRIDFLSTDHAPHTVAEKSSSNPSGVPLLDTHGGFVTWLMEQGFSPLQVARHCCELPGRFMRRRLGRLQPGYRGHLAILAPAQPWTVRAEELHTKCGWSPFEGETFPGRVVYTVASGRLYREGLEIT